MALNFSNSDASAIAGGRIAGATNVTVRATGDDSRITLATAGSAGGTAITPVVAIASSDNDTTAVLAATTTGTLLATGNVVVETDRKEQDATTADAGTRAANVGLGAALALTFGFQDNIARIDRSVTAGNVTLSSRFTADLATRSTASTRGVGSNSRGNARGQVANEVGFANAKSGQTAAMPSTTTSAGEFGLAAALALNSQHGSVRSLVSSGVTVNANAGSARIEALRDIDATSTADASLAKGASDTGIAAAAAINSLGVTTLAEIDGRVVATGDVILRSGMAIDASSPGLDTVKAQAISGASGATFAGAGAFAFNDIAHSSTAFVATGANVTGGGVDISATQTTDATTIATADGSAGASSSGVGVGASFALTISNDDVTARIGGGAAVVTGSGGLVLSASGTHAIHGTAKAGSTSGSVGVAPAVVLTLSQNDALADLPAGTGLSLSGAVTISATNAVMVDGTAGSAGAGSSAGLGVSVALGIVEDTAKVLLSRTVTSSGPITGRTANTVDVNLTATASAAGAKPEQGQKPTANAQLGKELSFANSAKGGTPATAPSASTSSGDFGAAGALALSIVDGESTARQTAGTLRSTSGSVSVEALSDVDSAVTADGSLVRSAGNANVGAGAAVAINALSLTTTAEVLGTVTAAQGVTVRTGMAPDSSSNGIDKISAKAVSGAGSTSFGLSGALGLDVLSLGSAALVGAGATVTGGTAPVSVTALEATDATTIGTSDAKSGAGGDNASGIGIGIGAALTISNNDVRARVDGGATVRTGIGGLALSANGTHAVHGEAQAGATAGSVGIAPSTFIVVSQNDTTAELATGATTLSLSGPVSLAATHAVTIGGGAGTSAAGQSAGIGASIALALVEDTGLATIARSITVAGTSAAVTARASNLVDVTLTSKASAAGGKAENTQTTTTDQQGKKELDFANGQRADQSKTPATAPSAEAPDSKGDGAKVGIAGALSLSIVNSKSAAELRGGTTIRTPSIVTIEAIGDADSRVTADGSTVDKTKPNYGIGVAVAINAANHATTAIVDGTVSSGGLVIRALAPTDATERYSDISANAISGASGATVGAAGAFALNVVNMKARALLDTDTTQTATGNVVIASEVMTRPEAIATSTAAALPTNNGGAGAGGGQGGGSGVGVGLSVALNILVSESTASLPDNVAIIGGRDVTILARNDNLTRTWATSGSSQGATGVAPALALLVAVDHTTATLGTGRALAIGGALTLSAQQKVTGDTKSDASVKETSGTAVGAAIALNIIEDTADAAPQRRITAGTGVTVAADMVADVQATAIAATGGVKPKSSDAKSTDAQVAGATKFANTKSGGSTTAPQVAKTNGGKTSENSVGVSAALALNIINTHARALLPATITVASGGGIAVLSSLDVDGAAVADASTVQESTGIGAAVALNVVNADNTAQVLASRVTAVGDITIKASMSANGDGVDTFLTKANSGAGATSIGIAGSVAIEILNVKTTATLPVAVNAGGGNVSVIAENRSDAAAMASSSATVKGQSSGSSSDTIGVGAAFALSVLNLATSADVPDGIAILGARDVTVSAKGDHKAVTTANAGSASDISVSPAVAITIAGSDTTARIGTLAATQNLTASGTVTVEAVHGGDYTTKADGQSGGAKVGVGAAIALGIVLERSGAVLARNVSAGGDVRIRATNVMSSDTQAFGGAKGNDGNDTSDSEAQKTLDNNTTIQTLSKLSGISFKLPAAAEQLAKAYDKISAIADGKAGGDVGVGAAIGFNIVLTDATAQIPASRIVTAGGRIEVASALQVDATAKAIGTAISTQNANTSVGAGAAVNIVTAKNSASIGDNATITAGNGVAVIATMAPRGTDTNNDITVHSAAASGAEKTGIAGAVTVDVLTYDTTASLGINDNVRGGSGAVDVAADARFVVQNLAGSGAFSKKTGVGGAVVVQASTITTLGVVGHDAQIDGVGGAHVTSAVSYVPKSEDFKGLVGIAVSSGAFGGTVSQSDAAIAGSVNVSGVNLDTQARLDRNVRVNQRAAATGSVVVDAQSTLRLFSGAGGVGGSEGNTGVGFGIDVGIITQKTLGQVGDNVRIATGGDVSIAAHSLNRQTSVAGSFGGSVNGTGVAGSIAVNLYNQGSDPLFGTRALVGTGAVITSGGKVSVVAGNPRDAAGQIIGDTLAMVAGSVGASADGSAGGIGIAFTRRDDTFIASIGDGSTIAMATGFDVAATSGRTIDMVGAAGAGGEQTGAAGSVTVSLLNETASATIGRNVTVSGSTNTADIRIVAVDRTDMVKVAGAAGFGGDSGIGAGLDVGVLTKRTTASIGAGSQINTQGSVEVRARSTEDVVSVSATGAGSSGTSVSGSISAQVHDIKTRAFIEGTTAGPVTSVVASGNVIVEAAGESDLNVFAGGLAIGSNAIGASAPIPIVTKVTEAFIGQNARVTGLGLNPATTVRSGGFDVTFVPKPGDSMAVTANLTAGLDFSAAFSAHGTKNAGSASPSLVRTVAPGTIGFSGVGVSATNYDNIGVIAISGGAAESVAVNVAGIVNVSNIRTSGRIEKGVVVNGDGVGGPNQNVLVVGADDYRSLVVVASAAASGESAVAPSIGVDVVNLNTEAVVAGTARVAAADSVGIKARSAEDMTTVVVGVAGGSSAGIGISPAIVVLNSKTTARIGDIGGAGDIAADVAAGGSVVVQATDDTHLLNLDGALGIGGSAGVGAGIGLVVINKDTTARIAAGTKVDAAARSGQAGVTAVGGIDSRFGPTTGVAGLIVESGSTEDLTTVAISGGIAGSAGVAGGAAISIITSNTAATIGNGALINQRLAGGAAQDVRVAARNEVSVLSVAGGLGLGASAGVAGAVGIGVVRNGTEASIGQNVRLDAGRDVTVAATSAQELASLSVSAGVGATVGVALSLGVWVVGGDYNTGGGSSDESSWTSMYQPVLTGAMLGGFEGVLGGNRALGFAATDVVKSTINLHNSSIPTGSAVVYHANGTGVGGLVDGQTYYVINRGSGQYAFAATAKDATAGVAIKLGAAGAGTFEFANNAPAQGGLAQALASITAAKPTAQLSDSTGAAPSPTGTTATIAAGTSINARGAVTIAAKDDLDFLQIAGQVAVGGSAGVGAAFVTLIHNNTVLASIGDNVVIATGRSGLTVSALSSEHVEQIAIGAAGGAVGVSGSGTVSILNETTKALLGRNVRVTGTATEASLEPDVKVISNDDTSVLDVAGAIAIGGSAGVGVGVDAVVLNKTTLANVGENATIKTHGSVELRATTTEDVTSAVVVGSAAIGGAVSVAASVVVANITTQATIAASPTTVVDADGNIIVEAASQSEYDLWGIAAAFAVGAGVGASAAVPVVEKNILAEIGDGATVTGRGLRNATSVRNGTFGETVSRTANDITGSTGATGSQDGSDATGGKAVSGGDPNYDNGDNTDVDGKRQSNDSATSYSGADNSGTLKARANVMSGVRGVAVAATNSDDVSSIGFAASGGIVGVAVAGSVQVMTAAAEARVGSGAHINTLGTSANQSVLVGAGNDFRSLDVAVAVSGGVVGVAVALNVQVVNLTTTAIVDAGAVVNAGDSVVVGAHAAERFIAVDVGVSGGLVAVSAAPHVQLFDSVTQASIGGSGRATVVADGSVGVLAEDKTTSLNVVAAIGGGLVSINVGGNVLIATKDTSATVTDGSQVTARGTGSAISGVLDNLASGSNDVSTRPGALNGIVVQANSSEDLTNIVASVGGGLAALSLAGNILVVNSDTVAHVGDNASLTSGGSVVVAAANSFDTFAATGAGAVGAVGAAGSLTVGIVRNGVEASIGSGVTVSSAADTEVIALSHKDITSYDVGFALAAGGFAGSVGIWTIGGSVSSTYAYNETDGSGSAGAAKSGNAVDGGGSNWNGDFDTAAGGGATPGGGNAGILGNNGGSGGNTSRINAAKQGATPTVGSAKPKTTITSQLGAATGGDIEGTIARIGNGTTVTAGGSVVVRAKDSTVLRQTSGSLGIGAVGVGVGISVAIVNLDMPVAAIVGSSATISAGSAHVPRSIVVEANQATTVKGFVFAGAAGLAGLGGQVLVVNDKTNQTAEVGAGTSLTASRDIAVSATSTQRYGGGALGASFGLGVAAGITVAIVNVTGGTYAILNGSSSAGHDVSVTSVADVDASTQSFGIGISGGISINGAITSTSIVKPVYARLGGPTTSAGNVVSVKAIEFANASADSFAMAISLGGALGIAAANTTVTSDILADAGGTIRMNGGLDIEAHFNTDDAGNRLTGKGVTSNAFSVGVSALAGAAGAVTLATESPIVVARINPGTSVTLLDADFYGIPDVTVRGLSGTNAQAKSQGIGFGLLGGSGTSVALAVIGGSNSALVEGAILLGDRTFDGRLGRVNVDARSQEDAGAIAVASGGGFVAGDFSQNQSYCNINTNVAARLGGGVDAFVSEVSVNAGEASRVDSYTYGLGLSGGIASAAAYALALNHTGVDAIIDGATIDASDGVNVVATTTKADAKARAVATGGSLGLGGIENRAVAETTGYTNAELKHATVMAFSPAPVRVHAESGLRDAINPLTIDVEAEVVGTAIGGAAGFGQSFASAKNTHATTATIGAGVWIGTPSFGETVGFPVGAIEVSAVNVSTGRVDASGAAGGLAVANPDVTAKIEMTPSAKATVGDDAVLAARQRVTVYAENQAEGDVKISGTAVASIAHVNTTVAHSVSQTAEAIVGHGATIQGAEVIVRAVGGKTPVDPATLPNYVGSANDNNDTIQVTNHGLVTGTSVQIGVQHDLNPDPSVVELERFAGIEMGRVLPIIKVDDNTIRLGQVIGAAQVDDAKDTIAFVVPHGFKTGDQVMYAAADGSSGQHYWVNVIDANTIKLLDYDPNDSIGQFKFDGLRFDATKVDANANTIQVSSVFYSEGDRVTYRKASPGVEFGTRSINSVFTSTNQSPTDPTSTITLDHNTFKVGDLVTYRVTGGAAINGLVDGQQYVVASVDGSFVGLGYLFNNVIQPIQFLDHGGDQAVHSLTLVDQNTTAGLGEGDVYTLHFVDATHVQLRTLAGATVDLTGAAGGGVSRLVKDGVDLAAEASDRQVYLDLQPQAGSVQILGPGGVDLNKSMAAKGDGISTVVAEGLTIGIGSFDATTAAAHVTSNVHALVLNGLEGQTRIVGDSFVVDARNQAYANTTVSGDGGGFVAIPQSRATVEIGGDTRAVVGDIAGNSGARNVEVLADRVSVTADAIFRSSANASGVSGGFIAGGGSNARAATTYATLAGIGQGAYLHATPDGDISVAAHTSHSELTNTSTKSGAFAAGTVSNGAANAGSFADGRNQVIIGSGATLMSLGTLHLSSSLTDTTLESRAYSYSLAAGGFSDATGRAVSNERVELTLQGGSVTEGDRGVTIYAGARNVNVRTQARSVLTAAGGTTDTYADNQDKVSVLIDAQQGAKVEAGSPLASDRVALRVTTELEVNRYWDLTKSGAVVGPDDLHEPGTGDESSSQIIWNADVVLRKVNAPHNLTIGADGKVLVADGVSIDGYDNLPLLTRLAIGPLVGSQTGAVISVDNITTDAVNHAVFKATVKNTTESHVDKRDPHDVTSVETEANGSTRAVITGDKGTWSIGKGAGGLFDGDVRIYNYSTKPIVINNIDAIGSNTNINDRTVDIQVANAVGFKFAITPFYGAGLDTPTVSIINAAGDATAGAAGDIRLNGIINNPVGRTEISSKNGSIVQTNAAAVVRTKDLYLSAGQSVGTRPFYQGESTRPATPLIIEFVQSRDHTKPTASIVAGHDVFIDVTTILRDSSVGSATVTFNQLKAGPATSSPPSILNAIFHSARNEAASEAMLGYFIPAMAVVGASASTVNTSASLSESRGYREFYYTDSYAMPSSEVRSAYGVDFGLTAPVTYDILSLQGGSIDNSLWSPDANVTIKTPPPFIIIDIGGLPLTPLATATPTTLSAIDTTTATAPALAQPIATVAPPAIAPATTAVVANEPVAALVPAVTPQSIIVPVTTQPIGATASLGTTTKLSAPLAATAVEAPRPTATTSDTRTGYFDVTEAAAVAASAPRHNAQPAPGVAQHDDFWAVGSRAAKSRSIQW